MEIREETKKMMNDGARTVMAKRTFVAYRKYEGDWIDFNEIRCGDVFRAEDDDYYYYMRVSGSAKYNAVEIGTGQLVCFGGELVSPVHNAKMVVNF